MNIDYDRLGRVLYDHECELESIPHPVIFDNLSDQLQNTFKESARAVITASGLLQRVEELEAEKTKLLQGLKNAVDMISDACDKHEEIIKHQSFETFRKDELGLGCKRCLKERVATLEATLKRVEAIVCTPCSEISKEAMFIIKGRVYDALHPTEDEIQAALKGGGV